MHLLERKAWDAVLCRQHGSALPLSGGVKRCAGGKSPGLEAAVEVLHDALEHLNVGRVERPACQRTQTLLQTPGFSLITHGCSSAPRKHPVSGASVQRVQPATYMHEPTQPTDHRRG